MDYYFEDGLTYISGGSARTIGFDMHFCAYGNSAISLYAGYLSAQVKDLNGIDGTVASGLVPLTQSKPPPTSRLQKIASLGYPLTAPAQEVTGAFYAAASTAGGNEDA